jgi:hypothetical protein
MEGNAGRVAMRTAFGSEANIDALVGAQPKRIRSGAMHELAIPEGIIALLEEEAAGRSVCPGDRGSRQSHRALPPSFSAQSRGSRFIR